MRILIVLACAATVLTFLFKWRYRVVNTLLAISFLRKLAVIISMNMPAIRAKVLPGLFKTQS
ncbi:hypothetical protein JOC34_000319 [Virgibacillus halotolerans]|nr:hypothetical protein [Virgibacillus halotolerans]